MDRSTVEHELTAHGLAFLVRSVSSTRTADERGSLFAIVDLAVAIEVLLKARLVREHWSLICAEPDKATTAKFEAGLAKTVTTAQAVTRLEGIAGVPLKALEHDKRIDKIGQLRNRAVHFTVPTDDASIGVDTVYGHALNFALWFLDSEFRHQTLPDTEELVEEVIEELTTAVRDIEELVEDRTKTIAATLESADLCLECPRCEQSALMFFEDSEAVYCGYCLWTPEIASTAAEEYVESVLRISQYEASKDAGGYGWPVWDCPRCASLSLVSGVQQKRPDPRRQPAGDDVLPAYWACFDCAWTGALYDLEHCAICNEVTDTGADGMAICVNCFADRVDDDD